MIIADYASVGGNATPNFVAARAAGVGGIIVRGAWGTTKDVHCLRDFARIKSAGMLRGAYAFLRLGKGCPEPESQMRAFIACVGVLDEGEDFPPCLDIEFAGGRKACGFTVAQCLSWIRRAIAVLREVYGCDPILYTSSRVWGEDMDDVSAPDLATLATWIAKPWPWALGVPARLRPSDVGPLRPRPEDKLGPCFMYQYQGNVKPLPGFTGLTDLSKFMTCDRTNADAKQGAWIASRMGGPFETAVVKSYQRAKGIAADGVIGPRTFIKLAWETPQT